MSTRAFLLPLLAVLPSSQNFDPSAYTLNDEAAAKFVRATSQTRARAPTLPA